MLAATGPDRITPLSCIVAPLVLLFLQRPLVAPATEFARDRAIGNSAGLIADIERFRASRGHYPVSLHSVWEDYDPSIMGIDRYHYEPHGEAYNLFFEEPSSEIGVRVFVVFNPRRADDDEPRHGLAAALAPRSAAPTGLLRVAAGSQPHWKSFLFD